MHREIKQSLSRLCAKVVDLQSKQQFLKDIVKTLCMMETELPLLFFDIMVHLTVHLVEELFLCGLVHNRWMYSYERYFKELKAFIRNLAKPEDSIIQGYQVEESLGFFIEYMSAYSPTSTRAWDSKEDPSMIDKILERIRKLQNLLKELHTWIYNFVLTMPRF